LALRVWDKRKVQRLGINSALDFIILQNKRNIMRIEVIFVTSLLFEFLTITQVGRGHAVAQWLRYYAASRKVAGSSPDEVGFLN
jgi:hypothetical protein